MLVWVLIEVVRVGKGLERGIDMGLKICMYAHIQQLYQENDENTNLVSHFVGEPYLVLRACHAKRNISLSPSKNS